MADLRDVLLGVSAQLRDLGVRHALVGGLAVGARWRPRTTKDADLAVWVRDDRAAEALVRELVAARRYRLGVLLEREETGQLATVRLISPSATAAAPDLDLLFASCGIEHEVVDTAEVLPSPLGPDVRIATVPHLIAMKVLSDRDQRPPDRSDLLGLLSVATGPDLERVRELLDLIDARGHARGKDLRAALDAALATLRSFGQP